MRIVALWFSVVAGLALWSLHNVAGAGVPVQSWSEISQRVIPGTVNIWVERISRGDDISAAEMMKIFSGSGFVVDPSGEIVTNKHLVEGAFSITVTLHDGTQLPGQIIATASLADVAVLRVRSDRTLPSLKLANSDTARVGDPVLAVGNPLGMGTSLSAGIISALNRDLRDSPMDDYIQTDAAINYGNSGGPLIDANGEVIGLNSAFVTTPKDEGSMGLGFAISSSALMHILQHLRDRTPVGWIGTHVQDTSPDLAKAFGLKAASGFIVTAVDVNSPAQEAGLRSGTIILSYGGKRPVDARALMRDIAKTSIGTRVELLIWQNGSEQLITLEVRAWPNLMEEPGGATVAGRPAQSPIRPSDLGMLLGPITDAARKRYALGQVDGLVVVAIDNESEAYAKGIMLGDVIEKVQDSPVRLPADFRRLVQEAARQDEVVALLVHRKAGSQWIGLHIGGVQPSGTPEAARFVAGHRNSGHKELSDTDRPTRR